MNKYFGTDGIRGKYGEEVTVELVNQVGSAAGFIFGSGKKVCIGRDTRESGLEIEVILATKLVSFGVEIELLGVISTPVISFSIINNLYDYGIMISASHNPFYDNGIKFFGSDGRKLSDDLEVELERVINTKEYVGYTNDKIKEFQTNLNVVEQYNEFLIEQCSNLNDIKIGLDCANGSAFSIAPYVFENLGADVTVIGNLPNGTNINDEVGSTHPEALAKLVVDNKLDFGFAFDGDADRIMLCDNKGNILDGDYIIYLLACELKKSNKLKDNLVVGTVMTNLGLKKALIDEEMVFLETQVGDRFVMEEIVTSGASVGGEQSGHIILPGFLPTGDGILCAVYLANIFSKNPMLLPTLIDNVVKYPQVLKNITVKNKTLVMEDKGLITLVEEQEALLSNGRILVRASGTEPLVRVMVEAQKMEQCEKICEIFSQYIKNIV